MKRYMELPLILIAFTIVWFGYMDMTAELFIPIILIFGVGWGVGRSFEGGVNK